MKLQKKNIFGKTMKTRNSIQSTLRRIRKHAKTEPKTTQKHYEINNRRPILRNHFDFSYFRFTSLIHTIRTPSECIKATITRTRPSCSAPRWPIRRPRWTKLTLVTLLVFSSWTVGTWSLSRTSAAWGTASWRRARAFSASSS